MSQAASWGVSTSGPQTPGAHAVENNDSLDALLSGHIGVSRPAYAVQGTFWNKDTGSSPLIIERYFFDGTDDILTGSFNIATNTFTPVVTGLASLTEAQTFTKTQTWTKGSDVVSATNLTLGDGNYFDITGTTTITGIATKGIGTTVKLHFDGILTLTHSAADLILPSGANITTAAGDEAEFVEYAAGDWRCTIYTKADGTALVSAGGIDIINFSATLSGGQSISGSTWTKCILATENYDVGGYFDSATNYRYTPLVAGKYLFVGTAGDNGGYNTGKILRSALYLNGSLHKAFMGNGSDTAFGDRDHPIVTTIIEMNGSTDYVEMWCYHNDTVSRTYDATATFLQGVLIG